MSINRNETILGITGLQKYYGKNHVLKGIDLNIHRGEVVAICQTKVLVTPKTNEI